MSLSGALTTAVSGLDAQSRAIGAISDNVANSQTTGYKRVSTSFATLLSVSTAHEHQPGGVLTKPVHTNDIQGAVTQTSTETNLAISGQGMLAVSRVKGLGVGNLPVFEADPLFTRAGDFSIDKSGYLVNNAGYYLNGWPVDPSTSVVDKNALGPVRITQFRDNPQATSQVSYSANLPANPDPTLDTDPTTPADIDFPPTEMQIFDQLGNPHQLDVVWTKIGGNNDQWTMTLTSQDPNVTISPAGPTDVIFSVDGSGGSQAGGIMSFGGTAGATGTDIVLPVTVSIAGPSPSAVTFNMTMGKFGVAEQTTMFTGTTIDYHGAEQDGLPPGSFRNLTIDSHGQLTLNYDNGSRRTIAQIPIVQFSNINGLQPENGNAYAASSESGTPAYGFPGTGGAGTLVASAIEGSNVDIASEFTKMIQTQRAYGANTRVVTITAELLEETNNMVR